MKGAGHRPKDARALPFDAGFRAILKGESKPPKLKRRPAPKLRNDATADAWMKIVDPADRLAAEHDGRWMRRRRTQDTVIAALFASRLVMSSWSKGCATVVGKLREQCRKLGVELPQPDPVVASSICRARMKVDENLFLDPHREILRRCAGGVSGHFAMP